MLGDQVHVARGILITALFAITAAGLAAAQDADWPGVARGWTDEPADRYDGCGTADGCGKARVMRARFAHHLTPAGQPLGAVDELREVAAATDVQHCALDIELFPTTSTITGSNTMTVRSAADGLTEFTFRLANSYTITSALLNGSTPVSVATTSATTRVATLDRAYNTDEVFTLRIAYTGTAPAGGFGSIEFGTQHGVPIIDSLSEPYYAYTWWPVKDGDDGAEGDNSDKMTVEVSITAPDTLKSISNGVLISTETLPGRKRYNWATNYPIAPYLVCFSTTNYNQWSRTYDYGTGTMPVEFSIYPGDDTTAHRTAWEKCLDMLATYRTIYGLYPFINEKYGIYEFSFGGGMEHQTYTGQGTFSESTTAHELSHQWWGDAITCKTWHDIWLNEGFATYSESLWQQYKPGSTGWSALYSAMANRRPATVNGSVYCYDVTDVNRVFDYNFTYLKGGWVLHQLRHVVGEDDFFSILAAHRAAFEGSAATTDDFSALVAAVTGRDLSWFFNEWVYGTGAPAYAYGWQTVNIGGQNYLRLRLRQTQSSSYGTYTMPIDVRVNSASGNATYTVFDTAATQYFVIPINAPATSIVLDENNWILTTAKTSETYVNGPAKIVRTTPLPGAAPLVAAAPSAVTVVFSENVNAAANHFTLTSATGGPVPFTFSYAASGFTATLNCGTPLPAGTYTLTVSDAIRTTAGNIQLDGEIANPDSAASLPSGDGLAGGSAVIHFVVVPVGDMNCDGRVNFGDIDYLVAAIPDNATAWAALYADRHAGNAPPCSFQACDCTGDGHVNFADIDPFVALIGSD